MENTLCLRNVSMSYGFSGYAIRDISFNHKGGRLIICGREDAGKNSLLRTMCGLENYAGQILYNGVDLKDISCEKKNFSFTFRLDSLKKGKTVRQILSYPFEIRKLNGDAQIKLTADKFILTHLLDTKVKKLSTQDKYRLIYARAFVRDCDMYFINATFADNDEELKTILKQEINSRDNVVIATCEPYEFEGKLVMLYAGEQFGYGTLDELIQRPIILEVIKLLKLNYKEGILIKQNDNYFVQEDDEINAEERLISVDPPFNDEFVGSRVYVYGRLCYDFVSERLITRK